MKILLDLKNLALYNGGIAHWIRPLLNHWVEGFKDSNELIFIYPTGQDLRKVEIEGCMKFPVPWPGELPRNFRHIYYDNWLFPRALTKISPQFLFSPYHDLRIPKKSDLIFSVITVHDLCFMDVPQSYPFFVRHYYLWMMRLNIARADHILTVSETTKQRLMNEFSLVDDSISIVPNAIESEFLNSAPSGIEIENWHKLHEIAGSKIALYAGGIEYRKNIERLLSAFRLLWQRGHALNLCITGKLDARWQHLFTQEEIASGKIQFLGCLSLAELRLAYSAADCIVYPSLCEGFGRVCVEAMVCGTPLACSDLPVFHEVAGSYPQYFDPLNEQGMARSIWSAAQQGPQESIEDKRFRPEEVQKQFTTVMNGLINQAQQPGPCKA